MSPDLTGIEELRAPAKVGMRAIEAQVQSLNALALFLNDRFYDAADLISNHKGHLIISSAERYEFAGRNLAEAFRAVGVSAFYLQPAGAHHGNLGTNRPHTPALLISNSGESSEMLRLIPHLRGLGSKIIAMVGNKSSTLAQAADIVLSLPIQEETPLNDSAATIAVTTLGRALAAAVMQNAPAQSSAVYVQAREENSAASLSSKVRDMMHKRSEKNFPIVSPGASAREIIWAMIHGRLGLVLVMEDELLAGIITDADLRRAMMNAAFRLKESTAADIMEWNPATISEDLPFHEAERLMIRKKITALVALDHESRVCGVVEMI